MCTVPQIEAEFLEQPARNALEAKDRLGEGRGKTGVGAMVEGKGEAKKEGKGDVCHPDVTLGNMYLF
jgi:hypothetical protein